MQPIRFGIMSTAFITGRFLKSIAALKCARPVAVASRSLSTAEIFAKENHIPKAYGSYAQMLDDPDIDAVYIPTPNHLHKENCLAAIAAGKHVLCEKPLALCEADAREIYDAAAKKGVFLMEAMWTRFLPTTQVAAKWIAQGEIGQLRLVESGFCFGSNPNTANPRLYAPAMGGGAAYDVGVYVLELLMGICPEDPVTHLHCMTRHAATGVDGMDVISIKTQSGVLATLCCGVDCAAKNGSVFYGTEGRITLGPSTSGPEWVALYKKGTEEPIARVRCETPDFRYEIEHMCDCIEHGLLQSPVLTPKDTICCARIFDRMMKDGLYLPENERSVNE